MKVALVGPAPPDRGGIAQQTGLLARALGPSLAGHYSYSRRYPRWLDPRRFDLVPPAAALSRSVPSLPLLDYASPASWRATARALAAAGSEAVVIAWWTSFWAIPVRALVRELHRIDPSIPSVLLCHNVVEHETAWWKRLLSHGAFDAADGFLVHSGEDRRRLSRSFPGRPALVRAHPVEARPRPDRGACREKLGVRRPLVLFLGLVRRYKGVDLLLEAAARICREADAEIAIVGEVFPDAGFLGERVQHSSLHDRVRLIDRYVTEEDMDEWLAACDVVVCPYRKVSGSGIAARAVAAGRPVVASDLEGFHPFVTPETGRLFPPGDSDGLAGAVGDVLRLGIGAFQEGLARVAGENSWESYASALLSFCGGLRRESATIAG